MAVVLGLLVSVFYGSGDFMGGLASKRTRTSAVVVGSFVTSTGALVLVTAVVGATVGLPSTSSRTVLLGVAAGLVGPIALIALYRGLALGRMAVVAPTTAVVAAIVPFAWGIASGERPPVLAMAGVVVALVAVTLISGAPSRDEETPSPADLPRALFALSVLSGAGFGTVYVLLGLIDDGGNLWPLVTARTTSLLVTTLAVTLWALRRRDPLRVVLVAPAATWTLVAATGVLDISANALYLAGVQRGLLSIVAVLASLYPAATVVLARFVLNERLHRMQLIGLALAAAGAGAMTTA